MSTKANYNLPWLLKMAWRDSRKNRGKLFLFISSILLGIAALVAINSFGDNLRRDIDSQAKTLLGADLVISSNRPVEDEMLSLFDSLGGEQSQESNFASMIFFPESGGSRLVQVRALEGGFPYYGTIETEPVAANKEFKNAKKALVDQTVMLQFNAEVNDTIRIGEENFVIAGKLIKVPGQNGITASVAPVVYIPMEYLDETGLLQKGSRANYMHYFKFPAGTNVDLMEENLDERLDYEGLDSETVKSSKEDLGDTFSNLTSFLSLVGFVALLLGCVGVASAVHVYIKEKLQTVAILRCLGLTGSQAFIIYLTQIMAMGLVGSVLGAFLGSLVQTLLPMVLEDFLPLEISLSVSWSAVAGGVLTGLCISLLFALLPLVNIRKVSPLRTLRAVETTDDPKDPLKWLIYFLIILAVFGFSLSQLETWKEALAFTFGLFVAFLVLAGVAKAIMVLVRKYFPTGWSFLWRQSLANLYRPNNQTLVLIVSIGLGTALITILYFVQSLLISKVSLSESGGQPNMVVFDIQSDQTDAINILTKQYQLPLLQEVPIVTMRLEQVNGVTKEAAEADSTALPSARSYNREFRVTYRDSLIDSETITKGKPLPTVDSPTDTVFISIEGNYAERLGVDIGDELMFNVQGAMINTVVGNFRDVEWNRVQTNFRIVFPTGVLEEAPQFHVLMTKVEDENTSANFQRALVTNFPNVSVIDLALILRTIDELLEKVSFVIQFMALFSIITGLLVLTSSVIISKFQRIQESVLLRTLGAKRKQILMIAGLEYFFLGSLASLSGTLLALAGSWALAYYSFETPFVPDLLPILVAYLIITSLTVVIGLLNSRGVLNKPPLEILRSEA